jgi:thioesterase domain-containing protein
MLPSAWVGLERLPLTANGKLDRRTLSSEAGPAQEVETKAIRPRDNLEAGISAIWRELLGLPNIAVDDNFFVLGGHSLKAMALSSQLAKLVGRPVPVSLIFSRPTIAQLAANFRQEPGWRMESSVVPLQRGDGRAPLFCVHPLSGFVHFYAGLARHMGADQPFYGIQSPGLYGGLTFDDLELMAQRYITDIREARSSGPYHIAGWSMGAAVAYEVARQLAESGEQVGMVALLEGSPYRAVEQQPYNGNSHDHLLQLLAGLSQQQFGTDSQEVESLGLEAGLDHFLSLGRASGQVPEDVSKDQIRHFLRVAAANQSAAVRYQPKPYPGKVVLFRTNDVDGRDPSYGLTSLALGGVEVHEIPGTHATFVNPPHVEQLARELRICMDGTEY